jgi:hypothetical protein
VLLGSIAQKLQEIGVPTVAVIATDPERARFYFRFRPPRMPVGADPELATHRAFGLPNFALTPEAYEIGQAASARELRRLHQEVTSDPMTALRRLDGYEPTEEDNSDFQRHQAQLTGQFLVDRTGIVRFAYIEAARHGVEAFGEMASEEEVLAAARAL